MTAAVRAQLYQILEEPDAQTRSARRASERAKLSSRPNDEINAANAHDQAADGASSNFQKRKYHGTRAYVHMQRAKVLGHDPKKRCPNGYHVDTRSGKCKPARTNDPAHHYLSTGF